MIPLLTRRRTIAGLAAIWSAGPAAAGFAHAATDQRLVVILLRGALDGLSAVIPYGDPALAGLRGPLVPPACGQPGGMIDLGGFFGLHPALPGLAGLYRAGELLAVHAVAGATRSRSHFDAQDSLECGTAQRIDSGWLNRVVDMLPKATGPAGRAFAAGIALPLLLRGPAPAESWLPEGGAPVPPDLVARVQALAGPDPVLGQAMTEGMRARGFAEQSLYPGEGAPGPHAPLLAMATQAGRLLAAPGGPRIAALELGGWDTHAAQAVRLIQPLGQLDQMVLALRAGLGLAWAQTVVLIATEFGRTARINGTGGTDHGTAGVAFLAGGAVRGGRIAGTWPGLGSGKLFEDRDLAPTMDLLSVASGVLSAQFNLSREALERVFPGWSGKAMIDMLKR